MGTILKRKSSSGEVSYFARIRKKGVPARVATFSRITDAKEWIAQEELKIRRGLNLDYAEAEKRTLRETFERFIRDEKPTRDRILHLKRWAEKLGALYLNAISEVKINDACANWKNVGVESGRKVQGPTLNRHLDSLSVVFKAAREWGWATRNPVRDAKRYKEPKGRVRYLSDEEREQLLKVAKDDPYKPLYLVVVLALSTGMRKEELLSITWTNVDLSKGTIILPKTKNGERRRVAVRGLAHELLLQHAKIRRIDSDFVFPGEKPSPDKPCNQVDMSDRHMDIRKAWERTLRKSKIKDFHFHDLRHSCASYLAMNGATQLEIAEVLGHKTLDVTKRYVHLSESHTAEVVESMNRKIFGA